MPEMINSGVTRRYHDKGKKLINIEADGKYPSVQVNLSRFFEGHPRQNGSLTMLLAFKH